MAATPWIRAFGVCVSVSGVVTWPSPVRRLLDRRKRHKRARTKNDIREALDNAWRNSRSLDFALEKDRLIILSDQHKGARDGADDFQRCERSYNAALTYYNELKYHLVLLGDVEELWENSFEEVASCYETTLELEAAFHTPDRRYTRLWGNHDLAWSDYDLFEDRMTEHGVGDVRPIEALRLVLREPSGEVAGELFLVHGHQGTESSDKYRVPSQLLVRHGWRRLQRLLNRPWNTPVVDWALRGEHAEDMAAWAGHNRCALIAGHTHLPVFPGAQKEPAITPEQVVVPEGEADPVRREALRQARLGWAEAEQERLSRQEPPNSSPWYFNTGCCSFGDGDITGIELSEGKIKLIRWPCEPGTRPLLLGVPHDLESVVAGAAGA